MKKERITTKIKPVNITNVALRKGVLIRHRGIPHWVDTYRGWLNGCKLIILYDIGVVSIWGDTAAIWGKAELLAKVEISCVANWAEIFDKAASAYETTGRATLASWQRNIVREPDRGLKYGATETILDIDKFHDRVNLQRVFISSFHTIYGRSFCTIIGRIWQC